MLVPAETTISVIMTRQYTDQDWEAKKPLVVTLYHEQGKTREQVHQALVEDGFDVRSVKLNTLSVCFEGLQ